MRELYTSPEVEVIEFDTKDVITTSPFENTTAESSTEDTGWTGLY